MNTINFFKLNPVPVGIDESIVLNGLVEILDPEDDKLVAVQDWNGQDVMFAFVSEIKAMKMLEHFKNHNVLAEHRNVTEDILMSRDKSIDFEKVFEDESYKKLLNKFLKKNLTMNMILEKISEQGIATVTNLDREVMEIATRK